MQNLLSILFVTSFVILTFLRPEEHAVVAYEPNGQNAYFISGTTTTRPIAICETTTTSSYVAYPEEPAPSSYKVLKEKAHNKQNLRIEYYTANYILYVSFLAIYRKGNIKLRRLNI